MTCLDSIATKPGTLADRLSEGRMPPEEAFRYGILLAEALRGVHAAGKVHGAVSPECIILTEDGIDLTPAPSTNETVTPYTAPERLHGQLSGFPTDVFSFGALFYEMLTGRKAFAGRTASELAAALAAAVPAPTGIQEVDQLILGCLAKDPQARLQSAQKVLLELKLVRARAEVTVSMQNATRLHAEMHEFEARIVARLEESERSGAAVQQAATNTLDTLHTQLRAYGTELTAAQERLAKLENHMETASQQLSADVQRCAEAIAGLERGVDAVRQQNEALEIALNGNVRNCEEKVNAQAALIASVGASLAQTDSLVERLVEATQLRACGAELTDIQERVAALENNLGTAREATANLENSVSSVRQDSDTLQVKVNGNVRDCEEKIDAQTALIGSVSASLAQTDSLVERLVEAIEMMQSIVLDSK